MNDAQTILDTWLDLAKQESGQYWGPMDTRAHMDQNTTALERCVRAPLREWPHKHEMP